MFARSARILPRNITILFISSYKKILYTYLFYFVAFSLIIFFLFNDLIDFIKRMSYRRFPKRITSPRISSPSYRDVLIIAPLTYQSWMKKNETKIGTRISSGANHNSKRSNNAYIASCCCFFIVYPLLEWKDHYLR